MIWAYMSTMRSSWTVRLPILSPVELDTDFYHTVLDLPQLHTKPPAQLLLSTLADLKSEPPSWDSSPRSGTSRAVSGTSTPSSRRKVKVKREGVPGYLTRIISSPLAWIEGEEEKEQIWEVASQELTARSGRSAMGNISRSFLIPLSVAELSPANENVSSEQALSLGSDGYVELALHEPALTADNLGLKTWASSYLLAKRLCQLRSSLPSLDHPSAILELGAGTGLVGLAAACVFARTVVLTDLPDIVPNLERNARANVSIVSSHGGSTETAVLDWSRPELFALSGGTAHRPHGFSLILAADAVYSSEHPRLLARAIDYHLGRERNARVVIELPLREAFAAERDDLRARLAGVGLVVVQEGTEVGFDDWSDGRSDELAEVRCWWSVWGWRV